jgi:MinD-like ATPase involved in chromosome partitioning or flagellar assembly
VSGIVVIGATGGCGATTIACAIALHGRGEATPLLVDADPHGGGPAALWGIDATRHLDDLAGLGGDIGTEHVAHLVHGHPCGIDVLAGGGPGASGVLDDARTAHAIAAHAASRRAWVADCGRGDTAVCESLVSRAGRVVLVVPRSLQGVARAGSAIIGLAGRPVLVAAGEIPGARGIGVAALTRALGVVEAVPVRRDDRGAVAVASARPPRGRGIAKAVALLVHAA